MMRCHVKASSLVRILLAALLLATVALVGSGRAAPSAQAFGNGSFSSSGHVAATVEQGTGGCTVDRDAISRAVRAAIPNLPFYNGSTINDPLNGRYDRDNISGVVPVSLPGVSIGIYWTIKPPFAGGCLSAADMSAEFQQAHDPCGREHVQSGPLGDNSCSGYHAERGTLDPNFSADPYLGGGSAFVVTPCADVFAGATVAIHSPGPRGDPDVVAAVGSSSVKWALEAGKTLAAAVRSGCGGSGGSGGGSASGGTTSRPPSSGSSTGSSAAGTSLGGLDLNSYCQIVGVGQALLQSGTWICHYDLGLFAADNPVDLNDACQQQYNNPAAFAQQRVSGDPRTWLCYLPGSGGSSGGSQAGQTASWSGDWDTSYGAMHLSVSGNSVSGSYDYQGGRLSGTISGNVLRGTWSQAPSYRAPDDAGDFEFTLGADGRSFAGRWRYGSSGDWHSDWSGTKTSRS